MLAKKMAGLMVERMVDWKVVYSAENLVDQLVEMKAERWVG
jgi:hypothetical protein